jgi:hypothetical protein
MLRLASFAAPLFGALPLFAPMSAPRPLPAPALTASPLSPLTPSFATSFAPSASEPVGVPVRGRARAFVLDLDGNAFGPGLPTKIILFHRVTGAELAVSPADFAVIERRLGTDAPWGPVNLRDWMVDKPRGSFREFHGPKFAADLAWAIDNLPAELWQGPSWGALVEALSRPETAELVFVLTARQHTSEQLLDGFRVLRDRGFVRFLPKVENLHGVGAAASVSRRKAEVMMDILDALQALPFGPGAEMVVSRDGAGFELLHTIGFSDDTWANHAGMRDALAAASAANPARWSKVKVLLFYTGAGDASRAPETIVLLPDGTTRAARSKSRPGRDG